MLTIPPFSIFVSVQEIHPYLQAAVIELEVLHGELFVGFVVLVAAEGFHEEDSLDEGCKHRDDLLLILYSRDMEAVFRGRKVKGAAFDNLSVTKMNYHPMLHHPGAFLSQITRTHCSSSL
jgi:hypothetical protein